METFFRGVVGTLSFLFVIAFCLSQSIEPAPPQGVLVAEPIIKNVKFEQVPATVNIGAQSEKQFNWKNSERRRLSR
jgi:hypothetical protein